MDDYEEKDNELSTIHELEKNINKALKEENYFVALYLALTVPDICGAYYYGLDNKVGERYKMWYDLFIVEKILNINISNPIIPYLEGAHIYQIRNSVLHSGKINFKNREGKNFILEDFEFIVVKGEINEYKIIRNGIFEESNVREENGKKVIAARIFLKDFCKLMVYGIEQFLKQIKIIRGGFPSIKITIPPTFDE